LIVDDCSDDAILTKYALNKLKVSNPVHCVSTAEEMMCYVEGVGPYADRDSYPYPAVVLLDARLPQMSGLAAQSWLRSNPNHRDIPIIAVSHDLNLEQLQTAVRCGANGYLFKPIKPANFSQLCEQLHVALHAADAACALGR
jgi:CheY-like chemotaxis protein